MKRKLMKQLLSWKNNSCRIPFMLVGARQVGKTYIIDEFCTENYDNYLYINLEKERDIRQVFESTIDPKEVIDTISILKNIVIDIYTTIIFFDEIQVSEKAITSLKYFNEANENYHIICAGSLLGVALNRFQSSFPVGKIIKQTLYPMDFEEFLFACGEKLLAKKIQDSFDAIKPMLEPLHKKALRLYRDYLYVGGMPASILEYKRCNNSLVGFNNLIKKNILEAYMFDMSKYTSGSEHMKITKMYSSIPRQLNRENTKFTYKLIDDTANKKSYDTAIDWLIHSNLVNLCTLNELPKLPLVAYEKPNFFKVYLSDVGLLCELAEITPKDLISDEINLYRGMLTENYVAQSLTTNSQRLYYWKSKRDAEMDFILHINGAVIPLEVKASTNTKSKSLKVYCEKYNPKYSIKMSAKNFGATDKIRSVPLYAAHLLK
jgi:uncharacterized protein